MIIIMGLKNEMKAVIEEEYVGEKEFIFCDTLEDVNSWLIRSDGDDESLVYNITKVILLISDNRPICKQDYIHIDDLKEILLNENELNYSKKEVDKIIRIAKTHTGDKGIGESFNILLNLSIGYENLKVEIILPNKEILNNNKNTVMDKFVNIMNESIVCASDTSKQKWEEELNINLNLQYKNKYMLKPYNDSGKSHLGYYDNNKSEEFIKVNNLKHQYSDTTKYLLLEHNEENIELIIEKSLRPDNFIINYLDEFKQFYKSKCDKSEIPFLTEYADMGFEFKTIQESTYDTNGHILIYGEPGTGKELIANMIGDCSEKELLAINCATLVSGLADSQLFGHAKGAFTDAVSEKTGFIGAANIDNKILFLDEIHTLSPSILSKLLRFLESNEYYKVGSNIKEISMSKIIIATNDYNFISNKKNHETGFLSRFSWMVFIPSLRSRVKDIKLIAKEYFNELKLEYYITNEENINKKFESIIKLAAKKEWKNGNVRELRVYIKKHFFRYLAVNESFQFKGGKDKDISDLELYKILNRAIKSKSYDNSDWETIYNREVDKFLKRKWAGECYTNNSILEMLYILEEYKDIIDKKDKMNDIIISFFKKNNSSPIKFNDDGTVKDFKKLEKEDITKKIKPKSIVKIFKYLLTKSNPKAELNLYLEKCKKFKYAIEYKGYKQKGALLQRINAIENKSELDIFMKKFNELKK